MGSRGRTWAGIAHTCYEFVHSWPIVTEPKAVWCVIDAEVAANGVAVESNKKDIVKLRWDQLEACIGFGTNNWFAVDEDAGFKGDVRLP